MPRPDPKPDDDPVGLGSSFGGQAWVPELLDRIGRLTEAAALHLGLSIEDAARARRTATLKSGDMTVLLLPMGLTDGGGVSVLVSAQTRVPLFGKGGPADIEAVLQHAPGALLALTASIGVTLDGYWAIHRLMRVDSDDGAALATGLRETVNLADHVLQDLASPAH